jgi:coenzyme F420 biosynthesis associated uncharacterized protein
VSERENVLVDWELAERVAGALAGRGPDEEVDFGELTAATEPSVELVVEYTGLSPKGDLPPPELVDRRQWIQANLSSLRDVAAPIEERLAGSLRLPGALGSAARSLTGAATGIEVGLVSGYLAQRVVGQYDVALVGPSRTPRLLFVGPNLLDLRRRLGAERDLLFRWIALHETTHVVQFAAVPWLRDHIGGLIEDLLRAAELRLDPQQLLQRLRALDPRQLIKDLRSGELVRLLATGERRELIDRLQATMSVIEGYSDHVMDAVGEQLDERYGDLRQRLDRLRSRRGPLEAFVMKLLGLDMKLRQYSLGKQFADAVAERSGIEGLNRVWSEPAALPTLAELEDPHAWLRRTGVVPVA